MFARMRFISFLVAGFLLTACAATTPAATTTPTAVSPSASSSPASSRHAQMLRTAGSAQAPTRAEIERVFGNADIVRQEGAGVALTYRLETCALLLLFSADGRNAMRLAQAHPSARSGGAAPSLEQCAAEADARRS